MNKSKVSIVKADDYNYVEIYAAVRKSIELIGGLARIVSPGNKVFVKINHLSPPSSAEGGLVTHPVFVEVVLDLLKEVGADITVGDDIQYAGDGFQVSGFRQMCERAGVRLINLRETGFVETVCNGHYFMPPSSAINTLTKIVPQKLPGFILRQFSARPSVIERLCSGCSECKKICPIGAVSVNSETAKIDYNSCIRCMCCHEVCRFGTIVPKQSITSSTIQFLVNILRKLRATV